MSEHQRPPCHSGCAEGGAVCFEGIVDFRSSSAQAPKAWLAPSPPWSGYSTT